MSKKNIKIVFLITGILLLIPLILMQFTNEVNWGVMDFAVAAILLLSFGFLIAFVWHKLPKSPYRIYILIGIITMLLLLWAELAVGIFGSPIAGS